MNQPSKKTKNHMEQGYIISKKDKEGKIEFLELVYKDYTESRKAARKLVDKRNTEIIYYNSKAGSKDFIGQLQEVSPDFWINKNEIICIEVMKVKEYINKLKMNPKIVQETEMNKNYLYKEVKM